MLRFVAMLLLLRQDVETVGVGAEGWMQVLKIPSIAAIVVEVT